MCVCVQHDYVYMDISIGGEDVGRLVIEVSEQTLLTSLFYVKAASLDQVQCMRYTPSLLWALVQSAIAQPRKLSAVM